MDIKLYINHYFYSQVELQSEGFGLNAFRLINYLWVNKQIILSNQTNAFQAIGQIIILNCDGDWQ